MFPTTADTTEYELVSSDHVRLVEMEGETFLRVDPEAVSYTHLTLPTTDRV